MEKQHRISDRVVRHLSVQNKLVIEKNPLVQHPHARAKCKQHPEWPAPQRILDSIADGETGRQKQKKKIADTTV